MPNLRFPEFIEEWKESDLQSISHMTKGYGISKDQLSETGTPCILYGELYTKYKSEIISEVLSKTDIEENNLVKSRKNDIILPSSGETAIDISTARCIPFDDILLGGDLNIIRLQHQDGSFFAYQLNGVRKLDIAKIAQGVSVVHLYGDSLKRLKVKFPSIEEQNKIASLLALIDKRIETQSKIIDKLQSLMRGIARTLTAKTPNTKIADCLVCHSCALQENQVVKLGKYRVYGASGVCGFTDQPDVKIDSILIVKDGSGVGTVRYAEGKYSVIGTSNYLTAKDGYLLRYLYYCLMCFNFTPYKTGMAIPHIYFKDYGKAKIYCPAIEMQRKVVATLSKIEHKIETQHSIMQQYSMQKQYLLQKMFI